MLSLLLLFYYNYYYFIIHYFIIIIYSIVELIPNKFVSGYSAIYIILLLEIYAPLK